MKINWLIERESFEDNVESFLAEIQRQGHCIQICNYVPFEGDDQYLKLFAPEECVIFYGSLQMGRQVQRQAKWVPGVYCNLPEFECTNYYPLFGDFLLNSNYVMLPYGDLLRRKDFLLQSLGRDGCVFVRPSNGFKTFTGKVIAHDTWEQDVNYLGFYNSEPNQIVVVAEPRKISAEWRLFIVDQQVVSGSQYRNDVGQKFSDHVPQHVIDYGNHVVEKTRFQPDAAWCLDVCEADGLHVVEVGCFSSAGLYVAPREPIVREVARVAEREWKDIWEV